MVFELPRNRAVYPSRIGPAPTWFQEPSSWIDVNHRRSASNCCGELFGVFRAITRVDTRPGELERILLLPDLVSDYAVRETPQALGNPTLRQRIPALVLRSLTLTRVTATACTIAMRTKVSHAFALLCIFRNALRTLNGIS